MSLTSVVGAEYFTALLISLQADAIRYLASGRPVPASIRMKIDELKRDLGIEEKIVMRRVVNLPVRRYAKAEKTRHPAHPLVAGFPLEHYLRHLANDPRNQPHVREASKVALTGRNSLGEEADISHALWGLHDMLQEDNATAEGSHPLAHAYNLMSAADKIHLDKHTGQALHELAAREPAVMQVHFGLSRAEELERFAGRHAENIADRSRSRMSNNESENRRLRHKHEVMNRIRELAPDWSNKDIEESIKRHALRSADAEHNRAMPGFHKDLEQEALAHPHEFTTASLQKASRYSRRPVRFAFDPLRPKPRRLLPGTALREVPVAHDMGRVEDDPFLVAQHPTVDAFHASNRATMETGVRRLPGARMALEHVRSGNIPAAIVHHRELAGIHHDLARRYPQQSGLNAKAAVLHEQAAQHLEKQPLRRRRGGTLRFARSARGDFLDSLRRVRSSNQQALRDTAASVAHRLGLRGVRTVDALHDTPQGSVPGVAQAIYGRYSPEHVHAAAAWIGLTGNLPGVAVFHARPDGPDALYRFRQEGSGMELRGKLDRFGLRQRVLVPTKTGFDVLIPDPGGRSLARVRQYAKRQGVDLQASRGHFKAVGDGDQSRARELFRNTAVRA